MSVETCWIPVLLWILCGSQLRWTHFDGFPWRDKPFGSMMSDFVGPCRTGPWNMSRSIPSVNSLFVPGTYDDMVGWGWSHQISPIQPFKSYIMLYIFTFFPVTRVLKVVIPIGCPVGPEVQTLGIFGSNPFYNLIQLIYLYVSHCFPNLFSEGL